VRRTVNFNIGQQNAANIQNIAGDATIEGGIYATATWETLELRRTIARTREEIAALALAPEALEAVNQSLDAASQEAAAERPDRYKVGEHLGAAARTLKEAGALVGAGAALFQTLRRATELLGPAGLATVGAIL
jgi:hypothetical protein